MTTITLTPDLEEVVAEQARKQATTPETLVLETLRERFALPLFQSKLESLDEWERLLRAAAVEVGV